MRALMVGMALLALAPPAAAQQSESPASAASDLSYADMADLAVEAPVVIASEGEERFAVEARHVVEVFRLAELTTLPGAPPPVAGVTAWRGGLLPAPQHGTLFAVVTIAWCLAWAWRRYR